MDIAAVQLAFQARSWGTGMPLLQFNGQWINYVDSGGAQSPVVLAHGFLMDHEMFAHQIEALAGAYRVITFDARCHGDTESTSYAFSYWDLADDLDALLGHLGINRAVIGGMGQGGFVALRFALRHPEKVSALVLMSTQAGVEDAERSAIYHSTLEAWKRDGLRGQVAETIGALMFGDQWPGREPWIAKWRQMPLSGLRQACQALVSREDIHDRLGEISAPALVIHGSSDRAVAMGLAQRLSSELGNGRLIIIDRAGHAANLTHPAAVNHAMQQFLGELGLGTRRAANRRSIVRRRQPDRRSDERRTRVRGGVSRRIYASSDRRIAERRATDRRAESDVRAVDR